MIGIGPGGELSSAEMPIVFNRRAHTRPGAARPFISIAFRFGHRQPTPIQVGEGLNCLPHFFQWWCVAGSPETWLIRNP